MSQHFLPNRPFPGTVSVGHRPGALLQATPATLHAHVMLLHHLLDQIADAVIMLDTEQRVTFWNAAAARLYGIEAHDAVGQLLIALYTAEWLTATAQAQMAASLEEHGAWRGEACHIRRDGCRLIVESSISQLVDPAGQPYGQLAVVRDISACKAVEHRLAEQHALLHSLLEHMPAAVFALDDTDTFVLGNQAFANVYHLTPEQIIGRTMRELATPEQLATWQQENETIRQTQQALHFEDCTDDDTYFYRLIKFPIRDAQGAVSAIGGIGIDTTSHYRDKQTLHEREAVLDAMVDYLPVIIFAFDQAGIITYARGQGLVHLDLQPDVLIGQSVFKACEPQFDLVAAMQRALTDGQPQHITVAVNQHIFDIWSETLHTPEGQVSQVVGVVVDVTARVSQEQQVQVQEARFRSLSTCSPVGIFETDQYGVAIYINPRACEIFGFTPERSLGLGWLDFIHPADRAHVYEEWQQFIHTGHFAVRSYRIVHPQRGVRYVHPTAAPIYNDDGAITGYVGTVEDITEQYEQAAKIEYLAYTDILTDLPNRNSLYRTGRELLREAHIAAQEVQLLSLDVSRFKRINETLGHDAGDELLTRVATRLRQHVHAPAHLFRLGSDEFSVLLIAADLLRAQQLALVLLGELQRPFLLRGELVHLDAYIGIAASTTEDTDMNELLTRADMALYRARAERLNIAVHDPESDPALRERLRMEASLRQALHGQGLQIFYQPIVDMHTGQVIAYEALLRWQHPTQGLLLPNDFLDLALEAHLCEVLDRYVITQVVQQLAQWRSEGHQTTVSINCTWPSLQDSTLVAFLDALLRNHNIAPTQVIIELTEQTALSTLAATTTVLDDLRALGVRIALDDFGSGYAALTTLHQLPLDMFKLDRSLVANVGFRASTESIICALIGLGRELGLLVVVEGVETLEQYTWLHQKACRYAQGHLLGQPQLPAAKPTDVIQVI